MSAAEKEESRRVLEGAAMYLQRISEENDGLPATVLRDAPKEDMHRLRDTLALGSPFEGDESEATAMHLILLELDTFRRPIIPSSVWPVLRPLASCQSDSSARLRSLCTLFDRVLSAFEFSVLRSVCIPLGNVSERHSGMPELVSLLAPRLLGPSANDDVGADAVVSVVQLILDERHLLLGSSVREHQSRSNQAHFDMQNHRKLVPRWPGGPQSDKGVKRLSTVAETGEQREGTDNALSERLNENLKRFVRKCGHLYEQHHDGWDVRRRHEEDEKRETCNEQMHVRCSEPPFGCGSQFEQWLKEARKSE